jgi:hypothetical protein
MVITSKKVGYKKQGSCTLHDNEPTPPTMAGYESAKGWKEVSNITTAQGGGNFLFPKDQILVVTTSGYRQIPSDDNRVISKLNGAKKYLVWYHHLLPVKIWKTKMDDYNKK